MPAQAAGARTGPMTGAHAAAVLAIYQAGIEEGNATFETRAPDWAAFTAARLPGHHRPGPADQAGLLQAAQRRVDRPGRQFQPPVRA